MKNEIEFIKVIYGEEASVNEKHTPLKPGETIEGFHDKVFMNNDFLAENKLKARTIVKIVHKDSSGHKRVIYRRIVGGNRKNINKTTLGLTYLSTKCLFKDNLNVEEKISPTVKVYKGFGLWNLINFYLKNPYYSVRIAYYSAILALLSIILSMIQIITS